MNILGFVFIGLKEDAALTAGFGGGNSCYLFFNYILTSIVGDCMSIYVSKLYGQKRYSDMPIYFWRATFLNFVILLIGVAFFIRLDLVLLAINFSPEQSQIAHKMILWMIPALIVQAFTQIMNNYIISADVDRPIHMLNFVLTVVIFTSAYPLIVLADLDVIGFSLLRLVYE